MQQENQGDWTRVNEVLSTSGLLRAIVLPRRVQKVVWRFIDFAMIGAYGYQEGGVPS